MVTLTTIKKNNCSFHVRAKTDCKLFYVQVYLNRDKTPLYGTTFNQYAQPDAMVKWANTMVKEYPQNTQR